MTVTWIFYIYAILLVLGGVMGFVKAKSRPSLISGLVTGVISLLIGFFSLKNMGVALTLGVLLGIGLGIFFAYRFADTRKPMPALFMAIMSFMVALGALVINAIRPHAS